MTLIADILMISGALGVAFYCLVLSRRLSRFTDLEKGMGGAVAVLSAQVDDLTRTLKDTQSAASGSSETLGALTARAEDVARRMELHVAAMHDLTDRPAAPDPEPAPAPAVAPAPAPERDQEDAPEPDPRATAATPVLSYFSSHRGSQKWARQ